MITRSNITAFFAGGLYMLAVFVVLGLVACGHPHDDYPNAPPPAETPDASATIDDAPTDTLPPDAGVDASPDAAPDAHITVDPLPEPFVCRRARHDGASACCLFQTRTGVSHCAPELLADEDGTCRCGPPPDDDCLFSRQNACATPDAGVPPVDGSEPDSEIGK